MTVTDADLNDLKSRVARLERASIDNTETITWLAGTLGTMKAVQDNHTERLDRIDKRLDGIDERLDRVEAEISGLRADMPGIVAEAMREVLRKT